MNATFNIRRFLDYEKRNLNTSWRYLLFIPFVIAAVYITGIILGYAYGHRTMEGVFSFIPVLTSIIIIILPSVTEKTINKNTSLFSFILPVSLWERFLGLLIRYAIVVPFICILTLFLLSQISLLVDLNGKLPYNEDLLSPSFLMSYANAMVIAALQAAFLFGHYYFGKYSFLKTFVIVVAASLFLPVLGTLSIKIFTGDSIYIDIYNLFMPAGYVSFWTGFVPIPVVITDVVFKIIFPFAIWGLIYFRLKEIEI